MVFTALQFRWLAKQRTKHEKASLDSAKEVENCAEKWKVLAEPLGLPWNIEVDWTTSADLDQERLRDGILAVSDTNARAQAIRAFDEVWAALRRRETAQIEMYGHAIETERLLQRLGVQLWILPTVIITVAVGYWLGSLFNFALVGTASAVALAVISAHMRLVEGQERAEKNMAAWEEKRRDLTEVAASPMRPSQRWGI